MISKFKFFCIKLIVLKLMLLLIKIRKRSISKEGRNLIKTETYKWLKCNLSHFTLQLNLIFFSLWLTSKIFKNNTTLKKLFI